MVDKTPQRPRRFLASWNRSASAGVQAAMASVKALMRAAPAAIVLALVSGGCFGSSSARIAHPAHAAPQRKSAPEVNVTIRLLYPTSNRRYTIRFACPQLGTTSKACDAITASPGRFTNDTVHRGCMDGMPTTEVHVVGTVEGRPVDIQQAADCGPPGAFAWWAVVRQLQQYGYAPRWVHEGTSGSSGSAAGRLG